MTAGRIYIPRPVVWTNAAVPAREPQRSPFSELMAAAGFVFVLAATLGVFTLLLALGPDAWGPLR